MDTLQMLSLGFSIVLRPENLLYSFLGVAIGTLVGVLPGLGPAATIAALLPATLSVPPASGLIMLSGIFYGAMYGGSTTSILVNLPGEAASVMTCLDGYQMARQGRAGPALAVAAFGSFIAGTIATLMIVVAAPPLAQFAVEFGPPEYFTLMLLGLTLVSYLSTGSMARAAVMAGAGILLGTVGTDIISGEERFTFTSYTLADGIGLVPAMMGLFGISEILLNLEGKLSAREIYGARVSNLILSIEDWRRSIGPILRGTFIGFPLGILPGGGAVLASFVAYAFEKRISRTPQRFGGGAIEGVAAPEAANNAASQGTFIPLLALGLPSNPITAMLLGGLLIHGVTIGPLLTVRHPDVFWGVIASMFVGNAMLLALNLPLIRVWVKILEIPYGLLFPLILAVMLLGVYSVSHNAADILMMLAFGVVGFVLRKLEYELAPLVLAFVLSPMMENAFRQSLIMSGGTFAIFFERRLSAVLLIGAGACVFLPLVAAWRHASRCRVKAGPRRSPSSRQGA